MRRGLVATAALFMMSACSGDPTPAISTLAVPRPTPEVTAAAEVTSTTIATTTPPTSPFPVPTVYEMIDVGVADLSMLGEVAYATTVADFERLWRVFGMGRAMHWAPTYVHPPPVDFDERFVVFYNRIEDGCPDILESLEMVGDLLVPTFIPPSGGCILPAVAASFAVAVDRASVPAQFTAYLPGYPPDRVGLYPDRFVAVDLATPHTSLGEPLLMGCSDAVGAYRDPPPTAPSLDWKAREGLRRLLEGGGAQSFAAHYEWSIWDRTSEILTLLGRRPRLGSGADVDMAAATFGRAPDGSWQPVGISSCTWQALTNTVSGSATWRVDPEHPVREDSATLELLATEVSCANGEPPGHREVAHAVIETAESVTVIVLVEPVAEFTTCPGNPEFPYTVTLSAPMAGRTLIDGAAVPGVPR